MCPINPRQQFLTPVPIDSSFPSPLFDPQAPLAPQQLQQKLQQQQQQLQQARAQQRQAQLQGLQNTPAVDYQQQLLLLESQNKKRLIQTRAMRHGRANRHGEVVANPDVTAEEAEKLKELEEGSMQAELKYIDKKWTEQGQTYFAETIEEEIPEQVNWWSQFALCLVRHMTDHTNKYVQKVCLQVNSPYLKDILRETIEEYPGVAFATKDISIDKPYRCLFHYRHELQAAGDKLEEGSEAAQHHRLLMNFINEEFKEVIATTENLLEQGMMTFEHLWTIFRPGSTIFAPTFGQPRAFITKNYMYSCDPPGLQLTTEFVDFDGDNMGMRQSCRMVHAFAGAVKIAELSACPTEWHADAERVRQILVARGRVWEQHAGMNFRGYTGVGLEILNGEVTRYHVNGRVVVDTKTYHRLNANEQWTVRPFKPIINTDEMEERDEETDIDEYDLIPDRQPKKPDPLTEEQCMLASSTVRGFAFSEKRWLDFFVDKLSPVAWNRECFDQLVLPSSQKDLVKSLVATHVEQRLKFDDIVKGKGKGLIFVLHGPPGVGKTLTAETVAEYSQRPLYSVSSGDLGTDIGTLDGRLSRILDMASTWKAVLLIDEADIFLERRSLHDLARNALVSIFLRVLEYYEGILFLTSNRVATFDEAFKSRIHVPLKYNDLTHASRVQIWRNFLYKMTDDNRGTGLPSLNEADYEALARADINGRQIKNVIRTAKSLAQFHGQTLDRAKLEQVIAIQEEFEHELGLTNVVHVVKGQENGLADGH